MTRFDVAVSVNVNWPALSAHLKETLKRSIIETVEQDIAPTARELSPWDTGHNRRTIETDHSDTATGVEVRLFTTSGYGGYVETGTGLTGPFKKRIYPKKGKFLRWKGKDKKWHFARSTAGMAPRPYIYPAYVQHASQFHRRLREIVSKYKAK